MGNTTSSTVADPDPGSRIRDEHLIPDHFSESLETVFWVKKFGTFKFFDADPESF
jgi:hypothetical protein